MGISFNMINLTAVYKVRSPGRDTAEKHLEVG
jgi:hypothetical protein